MTNKDVDDHLLDFELKKAITISSLKNIKKNNNNFVTVALYDAPMATIAQQSGVEVVLVGDSLGMTVLGFDSTVPVTIEHMIYHIEAVRRGNNKSLIIGDMPFMSYATQNDALTNAARIMQAGAHMVKLEGGEWLSSTIQKLSDCGIPVCAHLGLTPQSVNKFGGFRVQGREPQQADQLLADAVALEEAGADIVLMECIPETLAERVSNRLMIPTIGIGAGKHVDAQVLVINDILGITPKPPKFSKNFLTEAEDIPGAIRQFVEDVKNGTFPEKEHVFN